MNITIYKLNNPQFKSKMAGFDFDWTIVNPKDGNILPKSIDDWVWLYPNVPTKIKEFHEKGYMITIFTNQSKKWKHEQIKNVLNLLNIPIFVVIATNKLTYKPNTILLNELIGDNKIDKPNSFFVGDALGRRSDFSDCDIRFAEEIDIKCLSPEDMFLEDTKSFDIPTIPLVDEKEIIIMMGYPGSGKTTIATKICENKRYQHISGDTYKTFYKMKKKSWRIYFKRIIYNF